MLFHHQQIDAVANALNTDLTSGLTDSEANDRLIKYGPNKLKEKKKKTNLQRFLEQFKDVMILILLAAAIISFVIAIVEKDPGELFEPILILLIVVINAVMGVVQESKAEKALEALKSLSSPHARVIRNGVEKVIDSKDLVIGDIIKLEAGDFVPADARIISSTSLKSEESALTGESVPSEKDAKAEVEETSPLGDRKNMVYSGCSITYGTAIAVVTATGMDTEMGKIANMLADENDSQTPLQRKLATLGKYLGVVAILACAVVFVIGIISELEPLDIFMTAVSLAVSAIPEGLPAIVTIVLSIGVQRMVKKNAIIKRLPAVETLGSASVICSDKTGTLTQNRMTLVKVFADGKGEEKVSENLPQDFMQVVNYGTLCSDGIITKDDDGIVKHIGDPTETAIVFASDVNGYTKTALEEKYPRVAGLPFDSDRKLMTTVHETDGKYLVITKGAFDSIEKITVKGDLATARSKMEEMSENALRVLAISYKIIDKLPDEISFETLESELNFLGLVAMIDPPRPEAKVAVEVCRKAGIKPVMITGDHVVTARAIAKELGIFVDGDLSLMGVELDAMTDTELDEKLEKISVYARVSPENKIRIVKAWQRKGQVVAMTGDGVNDAPALKAADIGCAMGITGTDVAKGAADMTLTDDNFSTIVSAVKEGRGIYANIKKVVGFLLGTNIGELLTVFVAMLIWNVSPFVSMQLLWINLVTDSFPAIALGMEDVPADIMDKNPKPKKEGLFANGFGVQIILQGVMFAVITLFAYWLGKTYGGTPAHGNTLAFMCLALMQVVHAFNMRSDHSLFKIGAFTNKKLNLAALASLALTLLVLLTPIRIIFELELLKWWLYLVGVGLIFVPVLVLEIAKLTGFVKSESHKKEQK